MTARDEHVPDIERFIRITEERTRATYATLLFKALPPLLVIEMVNASGFWLTNFQCQVAYRKF